MARRKNLFSRTRALSPSSASISAPSVSATTSVNNSVRSSTDPSTVSTRLRPTSLISPPITTPELPILCTVTVRSGDPTSPHCDVINLLARDCDETIFAYSVRSDPTLWDRIGERHLILSTVALVAQSGNLKLIADCGPTSKKGKKFAWIFALCGVGRAKLKSFVSVQKCVSSEQRLREKRALITFMDPFFKEIEQQHKCCVGRGSNKTTKRVDQSYTQINRYVVHYIYSYGSSLFRYVLSV